MENKGLTAAQLRGKLAERGLTQKQFAEIAQMDQHVISAVLRGGPIGPKRKARIERAIKVLRLMEPAEDGTEKLIFRVTQL